MTAAKDWRHAGPALDPRHRPDRPARHRFCRRALPVLTGETGAGKSILLDAFALALGARGDASAGAPGRRAGPGDGGVRASPPDHPARALLADNDIAGRRRTDPAPRAVRRRPHPRLRQRPAGRACRRCKRSAPRWSKSTASTTTARWSMPRPTAACSTPSAGSSATRPRSRACGTRARAARGRGRDAPRRGRARRARGRLAAPRGRGTGQARAASRARRPRSPTAAPP